LLAIWWACALVSTLIGDLKGLYNVEDDSSSFRRLVGCITGMDNLLQNDPSVINGIHVWALQRKAG
jgi:hypothetical protein